MDSSAFKMLVRVQHTCEVGNPASSGSHSIEVEQNGGVEGPRRRTSQGDIPRGGGGRDSPRPGPRKKTIKTVKIDLGQTLDWQKTGAGVLAYWLETEHPPCFSLRNRNAAHAQSIRHVIDRAIELVMMKLSRSSSHLPSACARGLQQAPADPGHPAIRRRGQPLMHPTLEGGHPNRS
ncbi:hypothetical protein O3P69_005285 [Scylla paramamosain]|uniref:Uncharacterized protein n=1 Tax=Scylla paramamosain TaxID=85552 RepID=A0AAW0U7K8_SCYPA